MSYQSTILANNPLRYYRFGESSGSVVHDIGAQRKNGTINGGVTLAQPGLIANDSDTCYKWPGTPDGYVSCPDAGITSGPFTLEAWVNLAGPGSVGQSGFADILAVGSFGPARVKMHTVTGNFSTEQGGTYTSANYALNVKHHVVLTWNGTVESFWVDGVQDSTFTPSSAPTWSGAFQIGSDIGNFVWNGFIDEVAIYGYALSPAQITADYQAGIASGAWDSQIQIQTAMYSMLVPGGVLDATLASLGVTGVFDWLAVPQNQPFDYITLGDGYELPNDTLGSSGHSNGYLLYATVHVWSRQKGDANPSAMIDRMNSIFLNRDNQPWTLATLKHVYTRPYRCTWLPDAAGIIPILHIANQYQIYTVQS